MTIEESRRLKVGDKIRPIPSESKDLGGLWGEFFDTFPVLTVAGIHADGTMIDIKEHHNGVREGAFGFFARRFEPLYREDALDFWLSWKERK